ncbi:hypothetical protein [Albirhodobacter sp. R86504]|uniref:hypothetical protein n=1 Tax=Albirhodobacter sp. R86504 TaxID=3093848 RepID=UPI0036704842
MVIAPQFWQAMMRQTQDLLTVHTSIPAEVHYLADTRRWMMIQMALALHFDHSLSPSNPAPSPKSLTTALAESRIVSRNTVQAFLRELTRVKFIEASAPNAIRQRVTRASAKSERLMRVYLDIHLRALDTIDGSHRSAFLQQNPDFLGYLQPTFAKRICRSVAWYSPPEAIQCFTNSASGSSILHELVLSTRSHQPSEDGRLWIGAFSARSLAARYQVSPAHIARLLTRACALGAIGWSRPMRRGECWLNAQLAQDYLLWQAEKLAALSSAFDTEKASFLPPAQLT